MQHKFLASTALSMAAMVVHTTAAYGQVADNKDATAASEQNAEALGDIVITATRRSESLQKVPIAVQAIDSTALRQQNIVNFQDYVKNLPGVSFSGRGPGQNDVYIRGVSANKVNITVSGAQGTAPSVSLYLDDQPITLASRNLDLYLADMERIEVLSGPQGTLFGASSQAGAVRLITNKPKLDKFEAGATLGAAFTKSGDMSNSAEGYINIPIVNNHLAVRLAAYSVRSGGYIDNVLGTAQLSPSNPSYPAGATFDSVSNQALVEKNFNDSSYNGFRASLRYEIDNNWSILVQHTRQTLEADGVFDYDPSVGDLEVRRFFPDKLKDKADLTSWNVEGRLGPLRAIYTGGYVHRTAAAQVDYSGYGNVGPFIPYYICNYPAYTRCGDPTLGETTFTETRRWNHEFRLSAPSDWRFRFTAGVFYDRGKSIDQADESSPAAAQLGFAPHGPLPGATASNPDLRPVGTLFINDFTRKDHQLSFFGEAAFDIIPNRLTIAAGLRRYHLVYGLRGFSGFANRGAVSSLGGVNVDQALAGKSPTTENGTVPRVTLTWKPTDRLLFYGTYSKGFRPGGFNRNGSATTGVPVQFTTDHLNNYEGGWKTTLLDGHIRWNGAAYYMKWTDMQVTAYRPLVSQLVFNDNAADAEIKGVESDFTVLPVEGVLLAGAVSYNHTKLTRVNAGVTNVVPVGSSLAQAPRLQTNLRARYSWAMGDYDLYLEGRTQTASHSFSSILAGERFRQRSYTIEGLTAGISKDQWSATLYVDNITDKRADLYANTQDDVLRIVTNRPRTVGIKISYDIR